MPTIAEALALALGHHQAGRWPAAEQIYRQVLEVQPNNADALHLLGVLARQVGQPAVAIEYIGRAIAVNGKSPVFHSNLGIAYKDLGRLEEAIACYRRALELKPDFAQAYNNLGIALSLHGEMEEASSAWHRAIELEPGFLEARSNLARMRAEQGQLHAAEVTWRSVLELQPSYAEAHEGLARTLRQAGQLDGAILSWRRAVELKTHDAGTLNNLANALAEARRHDEAVACYQKVLELKPDYAEAHCSLGAALQEQGKFDEAIACCQRSIELNPKFTVAYYSRGNVLYRLKKVDEAILSYRQALELEPNYADAHLHLGMALKEQGRTDEAIESWQKAVELSPQSAAAHLHLAAALREKGHLAKAIAHFRQAAELKPEEFEAVYHLAHALRESGQLDQAFTCYQRALQLRPDHVDARLHLGNLLFEAGNLPQAEAAHRRVLDFSPNFGDAHNNLGNVFREQGRLDESIAAYKRALALKPEHVEAHSNLGEAFKDAGQIDEALACYRRALELKPNFAAIHSNLLLALQYQAGATLAGLSAAHAEYDRQHAQPLLQAIRALPRTPDRDRRLKVGFVSPDFCHHPVAYFLIRAFEHIDGDQWETICYSDRARKDDCTSRFQSAASQWRDIAGLDDVKVVEMIREDQVDVLFDLAGHTARNRLPVFARRSAPIQVTWLGYEGTTGLGAMDYILADRHAIPACAEPWYREQVLRMPDGYVCYEPPKLAPDLGRLPALENGFIRFGSFNNPAKISAMVLEVWATILARVPDSRLMLQYRGLGASSVQNRYAEAFAGNGIDPARLEFAPRSDYAGYLAAYGKIDLALDPFPFAGGITTCDALWMGVPVVTCPGETFASRHGLSHMSNVGLAETIARDLDEYVDIAVCLASHLERLAEIRAGLRPQMAASPLCDGKRFATNLIAIVREVWQRRCE
jgi:predicted O-linked N-acetylglucosamine transferase (SPINDLY family)